MALSPQLLQYKSSGVYRLEFDKSVTTNLNNETLRLVVGHSKKGPYNTPILISNSDEFINVFGSIDRSLEKKGMFFHRSAFEALSRGPILALNLNSFGEDDKGSYSSIVTNGSVDSLEAAAGKKEYNKFFDTDKFMTPSDSNVLDTLHVDHDHLLHFVNIKQNGITVIVRKAQDVKEFNIVARDWYGQGNVPPFMNEFDYVSDYMVDVFVFKGEFDSEKMSNDPIFREFFNSPNGLDKTKLSQFANLRQVSLEAQYTGSLIPAFKDLEGRNLYIESIINNESRRTGLFCAVNEDVVLDENGTKVDLVGHSYDADQDYELLSHVAKQYVTPASVTLAEAKKLNVQNDATKLKSTDLAVSLLVGDFLEGATSGEYVEITSITNVPATTGTTPVAEHDIFQCDGTINTSYNLTGAAPIAPSTVGGTDFNKYAVSQSRVVSEEFTGATYTSIGSAFMVDFGSDDNSTLSIKVGDYVPALVGIDEPSRLALVNRVSKQGNVYTVYCDVNVETTWGGQFIKSFENASTHYKTFVLSGATLQSKSISDVLSVLTGGNGIYDALIDKDIIDYRYVVDTFSAYDSNSAMINNKSELSQLAKDRQNASAILNAPTVADFKKSSNPSFTDSNDTFQVKFIADGGNLDKNPTGLYTLPSINEGANYAFYYGPGLIVADNGKDIIVPPAAYVSNNFIDKYTNALPWSIIAGPRRGVVSGNNVRGVEYAFDKADRDVLEPFGINPIVFQRGVGLTILGNKTAQQSVKSSLSSAHVREVLIYIQEGMANILKDYVFEFNNTQTRLEIKTLADSFMESVKADGGVYEFRNIMDQTNNTDDVIDNNFGIVDTYVEPVKGLEVVVHRTTILNTGEIQSGNFN